MHCKMEITETEFKEKIAIAIKKWGTKSPMAPDDYLINVLKSRGYSHEIIVASEIFPTTGRELSKKQLDDYNKELLNAVRESDLAKIKALYEAGKSMSACNKYGESILQLACRRSSAQVIEFMLENGADLRLMDDYYRNPLHDACWREDPNFEVVSLILDRDIDLIRMVDSRGSTPLKYVREEHWIHWCVYLHSQRDKYWPVLISSVNLDIDPPEVREPIVVEEEEEVDDDDDDDDREVVVVKTEEINDKTSVEVSVTPPNESDSLGTVE